MSPRNDGLPRAYNQSSLDIALGYHKLDRPESLFWSNDCDPIHSYCEGAHLTQS